MKKFPVVFVSSTSEDLKPFREKVRDAIERLDMKVRMFEYNPARGDVEAYEECMRRVREADVVVAIVAHWYGWIPEDQPEIDGVPGNKSITWLECEEAWSSESKIEVLGFAAAADAKTWEHKKELDAFAELAPSDPEYLTKAAKIQQRLKSLEDFKKEINKYQRGTFSSTDDLASQVTSALADWQKRKGYAPDGDSSSPQADADGYLPRDWESQLRYLNRPVTGVSWYEASAYAASIEARLPTEAEWERAARFGRKEGRYPWGKQQPDAVRANFDEHVAHPTAVRLYPDGASGAGLLDMSGNVWEWCSDWFDEAYYASSPPRNPTGPKKGAVKVIRGGSWDLIDWVLRCSYRVRYVPGVRGNGLGFRCVREVSP